MWNTSPFSREAAEARAIAEAQARTLQNAAENMHRICETTQKLSQNWLAIQEEARIQDEQFRERMLMESSIRARIRDAQAIAIYKERKAAQDNWRRFEAERDSRRMWQRRSIVAIRTLAKIWGMEPPQALDKINEIIDSGEYDALFKEKLAASDKDLDDYTSGKSGN